MLQNTDWFGPAVSKYLTGRLARFRVKLEREADRPIDGLHLDAALLLSDLCRFLGLDEAQHRHVLGQDAVHHVEEKMKLRIPM